MNLRLLAAYAYAEFDGYGNADILRYGKGANAVFNTCAPLSAGNNQSVAAAFGTGYTGFDERFYGNGYAYSCGLLPHRGTGMFSLMTSISKSSFKVVLFYTMNSDRFALNKIEFCLFFALHKPRRKL